MISASSRLACEKVIFRLRSPVFSTDATASQLLRKAGCPWVPTVSSDQITSSTVTGVPSENRASGRRVNSTQLRSAGVSMDSASRP
jgi:hypothetical protein